LGVQFGDLVEPRKISLEELKGRSIAFDGHNVIYQFLAIIRGQAGEPLKDTQGRVTSHLSGILYRNSNLMEAGVRVVYCFDGRPHELRGRLSKLAMRYGSKRGRDTRRPSRRETRRAPVAGGNRASSPLQI
jgi:5'-3' exonuclease